MDPSGPGFPDLFRGKIPLPGGRAYHPDARNGLRSGLPPNRCRRQDRQDQRVILSEVKIWDLKEGILMKKIASFSPLVGQNGGYNHSKNRAGVNLPVTEILIFAAPVWPYWIWGIP